MVRSILIRGQAVGSMPDDVLRPKCKNITFTRCQLGVFLLCIMQVYVLYTCV